MKLSSHKTYILPTGVGLSLIFITFLVFVISITFGHPFSYFITFFLISIIIVCAFYTNYSISNLKTFRFNDEYVECGSETIFYVGLSSQEVSKAFNIHSIVEYGSVEKTSIIKKENRIKVSIKSNKFGISKLPRVKIFTMYPLGIFKAWKYIESNKQLITYPKRIPCISIYMESGVGSGADLDSTEKLKTNDDFLDHRKFEKNDSWKHIDWKAYARGKGLLTKNFSGQESKLLVIEAKYNDDLIYLGQVTDELFRCFDKSIESIFLLDRQLISRGADKFHLLKCLRTLSEIGNRDE